MAKRVAVSTLNASTLDILNVIRANASLEYQNLVPVAKVETDIPRVGEVLMGYPALANQFINALVNRIALVRVKSATFNNAYKELKKGYLEFGETVEEVFVNIIKAVDYSAEKAEARELKRTLPDVRSAFHAMNWRVMYPVTIQDTDLQRAFLSMQGVQDLIARIVDAVYTAAEYDEFLLFKYLIIKAVAHGKMYPVSAGATTTAAAIAFRGTSNVLQFMSKQYNAAGVQTSTPKADQYIFMDAQYNAQFDVEVLASAFNMSKADFMGKLMLVDSFTSFDNDRFDLIRANSDQIEPVTAEELALMKDVKAVLVDRDWFQVYDNNVKFTEKYVASGLYWNYFYHTWKTVSSSPFANAIAFVTNTASVTAPESLTYKIASIDKTADVTVITLEQTEANSLAYSNVIFVQNKSATQAGIAVHKYGAFIVPKTITTLSPEATLDGVKYGPSTPIMLETVKVGDTVTLDKAEE